MQRLLATLVLLAVMTATTQAQWLPTSGPEGGTIHALACDGAAVLVTGWGGTMYRGDGNEWIRINDVHPQRLAALDGVFLVSAPNGMHRSTDGGRTWSATGLNDGPYAISSNSNGVFAASAHDVVRSSDLGESWASVRHFDNDTVVVGMVARESGLYAHIMVADAAVLLRSTDDGASWTNISGDLPDGDWMLAVEAYGDTVALAQSGYGVWRTTTMGNHWEQVNDGLFVGEDAPEVQQLAYLNGVLWATTDRGVYKLVGDAWTKVSDDRWAYLASVRGRSDGGILLGTADGVFSGGTDGQDWESLNDGLRMMHINAMVADGDAAIVASSESVYRTDDLGATWETVARFGARQFARTGSAVFALLDGSTGSGLARTTDGGRTWMNLNDRIGEEADRLSAVAASGDTLYAATAGSLFWDANVGANAGVLRSDDNGESWVEANNGLPRSNDTAVASVSAIVADGGHLAALVEDSVYYSLDGGANWAASDLAIDLNYLPTPMIAVGGTFYLGNDNRVFSSTDNGKTWTEEALEMDPNSTISDLAVMDGAVVAVATRNYLDPADAGTEAWMTWNGGWMDISDRFVNGVPFVGLLQVGRTVLGGTRNASVWRTTPEYLRGDQAGVARDNTVRFKLSATPNPTNGEATVFFAIESHASVRLELINAAGQTMRVLFTGELDAGEHEVRFDARDLPSGLWYYRLSVDNHVAVGKLVKDR